MTKVARMFFVISVLLLKGFFCGPIPIARAESGAIIINEIAAFEISDHEWIEIYNRGDAAVDLTEGKFWEDNTNHSLKIYQGADLIIASGEYAIIADVAENFVIDYPEFAGTVIDSSWSSLNESGEVLGLKDASGSLMESFAYLPAGDYSLERIDFNLNDYSASNWQEHPTGATPGQVNYWHEHFNDPVITDTIPPEDITNLVAEELDRQVKLSWNLPVNSAGDLASENLYINNGEKIILDKNISSYLAVNLNNGMEYLFRITAVDLTGNESAGVLIKGVPRAEVVPPEIVLLPGEVVINEFVADPIAGYDEWIELYNKTDKQIDLTNFLITEGSGAITNLSGVINPQGFLVVENPKGNLNNLGDIIILKNSAGQIIDQVAYGDWDDGNMGNNAPAVSDPNAVARLVDGGDYDNDQNDFLKTYTPTKGLMNQITIEPTSGGSKIIVTPPPASSVNPNPIDSLYKPRDIVINEFVADPADGEVEFVELYNNTANQINLADFLIIDGSGAETKLTGSIGGNGASRFHVRENIKGSLNNSGDKIILKYQGLIIDEVSYGGWNDGKISDNAPNSSDPYSVVRKVDGADSDVDKDDFVATKTATKGAPNIITAVVAEKKTDSPATVKLINSCAGIVINEVLPNPVGSDPENEFVELKNISDKKIDAAGCELGDVSSRRYVISVEDFNSSEILPGGFIVIDRKTSGIALDNSGEEEVFLFDSEDKIVSVISYLGEVKEGESLSLINETYQWTDVSTPGGENQARIIPPAIDYDQLISISEFLPSPADGEEWIELKNNSSQQIDLSGLQLDDGDGGSRPFSLKGLRIAANRFLVLSRAQTKLVLNNQEDSVRLLNLDSEVIGEVFYEETFKGISYALDKNNHWRWTTKNTPGAENQIVYPEDDSVKEKKSNQKFISATLEEVDSFEIGDKVKVQGKVAVLPGVFSSQIIYLTGSPGIQVYFYKKDWPELSLGDVVVVSGEISESGGERRIKISSQNNIVLTGEKEELTPMVIPAELGEESVGDLVAIAGRILEVKGKNFYLENNGTEIVVYIKSSTGIDMVNLTAGEQVKVVGIVSPTKDGYRVMPRVPEDITITGQVLGEEAVNVSRSFFSRGKKYLVVTIIGLVIGAGWWRIGRKRE